MAQINQPVNPFDPDSYINNLAPTPVITGIATNQVAMVGCASWGPVNAVATVSPTQAAALYGPTKVRTSDLMTGVSVASLPGASVFKTVRVTDGTDVAASATVSSATQAVTSGGTGHAINDVLTLANGAVLKVLSVTSGAVATVSQVSPPTTTTAGPIAVTSTTGVGIGATFTFTYSTGLTVTSFYTGSLANGDTLTIAAGSAASTFKAIVTRAGQTPEIFDNITGTGAAAWANIAAAINGGFNSLRGPSIYVVAAAGASTVTPGYQTYSLAGGADGASGVTPSMLLGVDGATRSGMYALRGVGPSRLVLLDSTAATWSAQTAFALSEGHYAIVAGPSGEYTSISTAAANKAAAGVDSYAIKVLLGDYLSFNDTTNSLIARQVSPAAFVAGKLASLNPYQSGLNKPIPGIVTSQSQLAGHVYSTAEIALLGQSQLDLVCNPIPGSNNFGLRQGINGSSNGAINQDNYSQMAPYLEYSFATVTGQFVGRIQTVQEQSDVQSVFDAFLYGLWKSKPAWISNPQGTQPYKVTLTATAGQQAAGYQIASVAVQLGPIIRTFLVNLQAGQTVQIPSAAQ